MKRLRCIPLSRPMCVALFIAATCMAAQAQMQGRQTQPVPGEIGMPYPPSAVNTMPTGSIDPHADRAMLNRMRIQSYKKMQSDTRSIQALSAELSRQVQQMAASGHGEAEVKASATKTAVRIDKLAAEVDRLMREH